MSTLPQTYYVYVLCRPNGKPFYVGKGSGWRVNAHESEARNGCSCYKCRVIRKIWKSGGEVQRYILLTTTDETEAFAFEIETIALYGRKTLTNMTDGGEGASGLPAEARARIAAARKAYLANNPEVLARSLAKLSAWQHNPEARERHAASMKEALARPEVQAKRKAAYKKRSANPVYLAKLGAARKAAWDKPGAREKASATQKVAKLGVRPKVKRSEESRERSRAALKAYAATPEGQAKMQATRTPEARAKLSASVKAVWERRKAAASDSDKE
jgi:hypothetical protein